MLQSNNLLLSDKSLLSFKLKFHVVLEQMFILTFIANSLEFFILFSSFSQMVVACL